MKRELDHVCDERPEDEGGDLRFVAHFAAPGFGQSWACVVCGRDFARVGGTFVSPELGLHVLDPEDVR